VYAKFGLPHRSGPESLLYEGPKYRRYDQCLMYGGLSTLDILHKTICCIGLGLCMMLEVNFRERKIGEGREREDFEAFSSLYGTPSLSAGLAYCQAPPLFRSPSHPAPLPSSDVPALRRSSPLPG
jgi:hypothetical protein